MTSARVLLLALMFPMCRKLLRGQAGPILPADILFAIFSVWNILTLEINSPDQALSFGGSMIVELFGGYMLGRIYIRSAEDFIRTCLALLWMIALTIPLAVYEARTGVAIIPEMINRLPFFSSFVDFENELAGVRLGLNRAQVVFAHPIHYGLFASTAFTLAYVGLKGLISRGERILLTFAAAAGVFFSLSSGAILPMVLQVGLIFWAAAFGFTKHRWTILLVLVALAYITVDMISNRSPITVFLERATFSPHNAYWRMIIFEWGMKNVWANPFFGIGMNQWIRPDFMVSGSMDNFWLVMAVRHGIPGFLLIAIGWGAIYLRIAFKDFDSDPALWQIRRAWIITFTSLIVTLCTVHVWEIAQVYTFFLLGTGVWMLSTTPAESSSKAAAQGEPMARRTDQLYSRFAPIHRRPIR